ncbi:hypothetical protein [Acetobacter musti]|uniref:hypothetical protein n=1 Tax=Acetobacter musti TaxID=864732 RepID=UPI001F550CAC|nr:hypothetical protein [Acetobacter musti]
MENSNVRVRDRIAQLIRTRKYIAVICHERWGGSFFSRSGSSAFIARKLATPEWIGKNIRKALYTSEDFSVKHENFIPSENNYTEATRECAYKCHAFWLKVAEEFNFKDTKAAKSKSALVFIHWSSDKTD